MTLTTAAIAQLGERQTEDLKVPGSIPGLGICLLVYFVSNCHIGEATLQNADKDIAGETSSENAG